jgi:erythromycin esterase-like protein
MRELLHATRSVRKAEPDDDHREALEIVRHAAFEPSADGSGPLVDTLKDAAVVLIGEASLGRHEFYRTRAELTKALIAQQGFSIVAVEADWPDAYRVNRWVRGASDDRTPEEALREFVRFPRWMWRKFHDAGTPRFALLLQENDVPEALMPRRLERAIGVIYRPDTERLSHYFRASLPNQFDAVIHIDETHALEPLEPWAVHEADLPETYPTAL